MSIVPEDLTRWIEQEQAALWHDLSDAIRYSANGVWSMGCTDKAVRVAYAARLVGATPVEHMPWDLVAGGVYAALCDLAGVKPDMPTEERWAGLEKIMAEHGGTRETASLRFAATVAAMLSDFQLALDLANPDAEDGIDPTYAAELRTAGVEHMIRGEESVRRRTSRPPWHPAVGDQQ